MRFPRPPRRLAACLLALACAGPAGAQGAPSLLGFAPLPAFAWPRDWPAEGEDGRWAGSYARMATGFEMSSSRRLGSHGGPFVGFEGGRMWQEGRFVYGVAGGFDYLAGGGTSSGFGGLGYSRDFAGALQVKVGALVSPDVLVYAKAGAAAVSETWRFGPTHASLPFDRREVVVRPDARVGVEWAVNERLSVAVEAGVGGPGFFR